MLKRKMVLVGKDDLEELIGYGGYLQAVFLANGNREDHTRIIEAMWSLAKDIKRTELKSEKNEGFI